MNSEPVNLGDKVKDIITGFEGIAVAQTNHLYGCSHIVVEPMKMGKDGEPQDNRTFDEQRVTVLERSVVKPAAITDTELPQGSKVKDVITGFSGIIIGITKWYAGVMNYTVQPETLNENGQPHKSCILESTRVKLIETKPIPMAAEANPRLPGGPSHSVGVKMTPTER